MLVVLAPLRSEALAVRSALPGVRVVRTGMGRGVDIPAGAEAVAVAGVCGAVARDLRPGDVVLATEVRTQGAGPLACPGSALLERPLRRLGLSSVSGPLYSASRIVGPEERARLRADGVLAVDMESYELVRAAGETPVAVLRVVVDTAERRLLSPRTLHAGPRALWTLRSAAPALVDWAEACVDRPPRYPIRLPAT